MRDLSGCSQGSIRVHEGSVRVHSIRVQSGFSGGSVRVQASSMRVQSGFSQGSVRVQWWFESVLNQDSVTVL